MTYDQWKTRSPDDDWELDYEEYDPEMDCEHEHYEIDILEGRCRCLCGHNWYASHEQVEAEIKRQWEYSEHEEREDRRQWWRDLGYRLLHPLMSIHWSLCKRGWFCRSRNVQDDSEVPF